MEEKMAAIIIISGMIILFIILGIIFIKGRGASLIAGYNTMPQEEKQKYDTAALTRFIGKMMFASSFCMLFWIVSVVYEMNWLFTLGTVLLAAIIIFMLIYINTDNRFKK
jgi:hypothetical protein